jgi:vesicle-associated membrane protein 7
MPIVYSVATENGEVLAEYNAAQTQEVGKVAATCLSKVPDATSQKERMSLAYGAYLFHYVKKGNMLYGCLATEDTPRRLCFALLDDLEASHQIQPADFSRASFSDKIKERTDFFNTDKKADKIRGVRSEIEEVRDIMGQNIERVMERGERIEILVDKTDSLQQNSLSFRQRSTELRRQMWWKNVNVMLLLAGVSVLSLYFLIGIACGLPGWSRCTRKPH